MKVVLDTNIFINATHAPESSSATIIKKIKNKSLKLIVSNNILDEYKRELNKNYLMRFRKRNELTNPGSLKEILNLAEVEKVKIDVDDSKDKSDNKFLECAISSSADYLITSDSDLLELRPYEKTKIVTPSEVVEKL